MEKLKRFLIVIGPGMLTAATGVGAGDLATGSFAGSLLGTAILWAVIVGAFLKFVVTEGIARWQLATSTTLVEGWRDHLPQALLVAFFVYFVAWSYMVASALVSASAHAPGAVGPPLTRPSRGVDHAVACCHRVT